MTGRLRAARVLALGLVLAVVVLAALSTWSVAEPKKHDRAAHGAPPAAASQHKQSKKAKAAAAPQDKKHSKAKAAAVPQNKQRSKTKAVSEPNVTCNFPWDYSRALHHCICTRDGYTLQRGSCVRDLTSVACRDDERWSPKRGACVCAAGFKRQGDACVVAEPVQIVVTPPPPELATDVFPVAPPDPAVFPVAPLDVAASPAGATPVETAAKTKDGQEAALSPEQVKAISRAQSCLTELGYYKGAIDGRRGKETWTAYWHFKHDHDLSGYSDLLADAVQQKFASLCKGSETTAALSTEVQPATAPQADAAPPGSETVPTNDTAPNTEAAPDVEEVAPPPPTARLDIYCLPEDLIALLRRAHGPGISVTQCEKACLPAPSGLPQPYLDELQSKFGIAWCRTCVPFAGHLALDDVKRIERGGNIELCATPSRQLPRRGVPAGEPLKSYTKVRELYRALPPAPDASDTVAVIIGNCDYAKLPPSETSQNDAGALYAFLTEHMGVRPDNIVDVRNAKKADLERLFGAAPGVEGDLAHLVRSNPGAKVLVYYSGHGGTDNAETETYLLPIDAEPYREAQSGYKLSTLYANLAKLDAKSVLVLLESEFGEEHGANVLPPNLPETSNQALPRAPLPNLTVMIASDRGQRTLIDSTYDIGLFTRYLIDGLAGKADLRPIGNGDGSLDSAEIYAYTAAMVEIAARKTFGLLQNPVYSSGSTPVLTSAGPSSSNPD
jgi:Caspase domain